MVCWPACCRQDGEAEVRRLVSEMKTEADRHKRELEAVRQQCRREVEQAHREAFSQCKASVHRLTGPELLMSNQMYLESKSYHHNT